METRNPLTAELHYIEQSQLSDFLDLARDKIRSYQGVEPSSLSICPVKYRDYEGYHNYKVKDHLVARWRTPLTSDRVDRLESLMTEFYDPHTVNTRRLLSGTARRPRTYRTPAFHEEKVSRGYLISDDQYENRGLYVLRRFPSQKRATEMLRKKGWLYEGETYVELRLPLHFTNLEALESIVRISKILADQKIEPKEIVYDLYRSLTLSSIHRKTAVDLAGVESILDMIRWILFGANLPMAKEYGIKNRSVMLAGVYGVGKTTIAKVLAAEEHSSLLVPIEALTLVKSLFEKKDDENSLFESIQKLQRRTGVDIALFCDDLEAAMINPEYHSMAPEYLAGNSSLLNKLQGIGVGSMSLNGSTNNPFMIDPRFLQFGRVGYVVHIPLPDEAARLQTLEIHTSHRKHTQVNLGALAQKTDGFSNRALEEICNQAGISALQRATRKVQRNGESSYHAAKRLTNLEIQEFPILQEDFENGLNVVSKHVRVATTRELDREIEKFCTAYNTIGIGFAKK